MQLGLDTGSVTMFSRRGFVVEVRECADTSNALSPASIGYMKRPEAPSSALCKSMFYDRDSEICMIRIH